MEKIIDRTVVEVVADFHDLFYSKAIATTYLGRQAQKNPLDLWVYQEILYDTKPDLIIETGTAAGGTTLFLAHILDRLGNGKIISIDLADRTEILPVHPRIEYFVGVHSLDYFNCTGKIDTKGFKTMVILDDDHTFEHVKRELMVYSRLVTKGQYLIVEDTNINGHPVGVKRAEGGPYEAVAEWLPTNTDFAIDKRREKYLVTFNPSGYLKRGQ